MEYAKSYPKLSYSGYGLGVIDGDASTLNIHSHVLCTQRPLFLQTKDRYNHRSFFIRSFPRTISFRLIPDTNFKPFAYSISNTSSLHVSQFTESSDLSCSLPLHTSSIINIDMILIHPYICKMGGWKIDMALHFCLYHHYIKEGWSYNKNKKYTYYSVESYNLWRRSYFVSVLH